MKILIINHYAGSPDMGMEFRPFYIAKEWIKLGHRVDIIAGDFSHLRVNNPKILYNFQRQMIEGINYHWVRTGEYQGNGLKRAFSMFKFVSKIWLEGKKISKELNPDIVIASSTYPLDTFAAQKIAKLSNARLIHEVHDMWPATLIEIGNMSKKHPFVRLLQRAEDSAYKHSDKVVSLLPAAKDYMISHGMQNNKFVYIPNGIDLNEWEEPEALPDEHYRTLHELKNDNHYIVGYFGGHALSNALNILLDVAASLSNEKITFVLVGKGNDKNILQKRVIDEKINNVIFLPPISKKGIPTLLKEFDLIFIGSLSSPLYRFGVCYNKIFDSMMSGKPILCAISAPELPIEKYCCGIKTDPGDIDSIINGIYTIMNLSTRELIEMGENGRRAVLENFTYKALAKKFEEIF